MPKEYSNILNCFNFIFVHFSQNSLEIPIKDFDLLFRLPASDIPISLPIGILVEFRINFT